MAAEQPPTFAVQLRRYREAAGLSQEDLAERAGVTAAAIGALERGARRRPFPHTVQLLAAALDLDEANRASLIAAVPSRSRDRSAGEPSAARAGSTVPGAPDAFPGPAAGDHLAFAQFPQSDIRHGAAAFVGRRAELAVLRTRLEEAFAGRGSIVMLVGEAGIGKSRLAREFADGAAARGAVVLWGCCFEGDWHPSYGPWAEALGAYIREGAAHGVLRELGPGAGAIGRLVPEVYAALPEVPLPSPLGPDEERFRLYDAIIRFFFTVSIQQPVVLVVDDLHWADPDSLQLLRYLARYVARGRMLVLGAYRDPEFGLNDAHPLVATLSMLHRESDYERIVVRGFSREEVAEYLAQASGQALPQALVGVIEEETSGNPFYAAEVLRHLTEEAKLLQRGGRWTTDLSIRELGIPEGVRQVVGRRVARLSEATGTLLRLASGFSACFGFEVLQALSELSEQVLLDCIDEALQAGLIRPGGQVASGHVPPRYEFAHAIVRHTMYDGLNPDRRARLHRRIALALEAAQTGGALEDVAELAAQYHASAALPGAAGGIPYALQAAEQARAAYSHERAADFLRMARDLAAESLPAERADILRQLTIADAEAVRLEEARQSVEAALEAMSAAGVEPRACAGFLAAVARALKDGGASAAAWERLVERGLALAGDNQDLLWARLALLRDHFEPIHSGPIGGGEWLGSDPIAVAVARAEGDEEDYARTLEPLDWRTRQESEAVLVLARSWTRPLAVMRGLDVAGRDFLYRHGAFHEARAVYEELLEASRRFGSIPGQGEALIQLAACHLATGDLVRGQEIGERAREVIAQLGGGHRLHFVTIGVASVQAYFMDGDWPKLAEAATAYAIRAATNLSPIGLVAAVWAAYSSSRAGDTQVARTMLRHYTSAVEHGSPTSYTHATSLTSGAATVWELGATEYAVTYRRLLLNVLLACGGSHMTGPYEGWIARMSSLLGDIDEAQDYFARARARLDAGGLTHVRAIVDLDEARALIRAGATDHADHDRARILQLLDAALDSFHAHGMLGWAERAAQEKERLPALERRRTAVDSRYPANLTAREAEVLRLIAAGLTNKDIAARLVLTVPTVERHVANIYSKIGASRRYGAIAFAQSHGFGPDAAPDASGSSPDSAQCGA